MTWFSPKSSSYSTSCFCASDAASPVGSCMPLAMLTQEVNTHTHHVTFADRCLISHADKITQRDPDISNLSQ